MRAERFWILMAALNGAAAVIAGAVAAHALKEALSPERLSAFETGARLHLPHAVALLGVAWARTRIDGAAIRAAGWLLLCGVILFSGSLYAYALGGPQPLVFVTPIGGLALILGWLALAAAAFGPER